MTKVSIVIPIYKVEKYLRECLDSVINQTLDDIEIILVDDGSPDNCPQICDEYAKKDSRIKVIHKENGGYGAAVNTGIQNATGEYIGIIESDDWVSAYMYECLYNKSINKKFDIIKGSYGRVNNSETYKINIAYHLMQMYDEMKEFTFEDCPELLNYHTSIWSAIYRRQWLLENNIKFVEDIRPYEDIPFIAEAYAKAKSIAIVPLPLYYYRTDATNSSMNSVSRSILSYPIQRERARKVLIQNNLFKDKFLEYFYFITYKVLKKFYTKSNNIIQKEFYDAMQNFLKHAEEDNLQFTEFNKQQKEDLINICKKTYKEYSIWTKSKKLKSLFIKPTIIKDNHKVRNILGIKIKTKIK